MCQNYFLTSSLILDLFLFYQKRVGNLLGLLLGSFVHPKELLSITFVSIFLKNVTFGL